MRKLTNSLKKLNLGSTIALLILVAIWSLPTVG